jgi:hypothetical protein
LSDLDIEPDALPRVIDYVYTSAYSSHESAYPAKATKTVHNSRTDEVVNGLSSVTHESSEVARKAVIEGRRLYIGNLAYAATEEQLKDFFAGYDIESTSISINPRTGRPTGYAFVDLKSAWKAKLAIASLSGKDILQRKVSVQLARNPEGDGKKTPGAGHTVTPVAVPETSASFGENASTLWAASTSSKESQNQFEGLFGADALEKAIASELVAPSMGENMLKRKRSTSDSGDALDVHVKVYLCAKQLNIRSAMRASRRLIVTALLALIHSETQLTMAVEPLKRLFEATRSEPGSDLDEARRDVLWQCFENHHKCNAEESLKALLTAAERALWTIAVPISSAGVPSSWSMLWPPTTTSTTPNGLAITNGVRTTPQNSTGLFTNTDFTGHAASTSSTTPSQTRAAFNTDSTSGSVFQFSANTKLPSQAASSLLGNSHFGGFSGDNRAKTLSQGGGGAFGNPQSSGLFGNSNAKVESPGTDGLLGNTSPVFSFSSNGGHNLFSQSASKRK